MAASLDSTDDVVHREDSDVAGEDFLNRLGNINPTRKNLLRKYLSIKEDESFPLLSEYFGVALAFTALGALIRRANERKLKQGTLPRRKLQRIALESMLKKAMERLHDLAYKAQCLQDQLNEKNSKNVEPNELLHQLVEADTGITEMKRRRSEETKANERVTAMFSSSQEHWKNERKQLRGNMEVLCKELGESNGRPQAKAAERSSCIECKELDLLVNNLKGELKGKEFLMVAAAEDAKVEQDELGDKIIVAEGMIESLKEGLGAKIEAHQKEHAELLNQLQKVELELRDASEIINHARVEALDMAESRKEVEALNAKLSVEQKQLRKEVKDQEEVISTMIRRTEILKAENSELIEKLNRSKAKRRSMRNSKAMDGGVEDELHERYFSRSGSMADFQAVQQTELHSLYMDQITELENQVNFYQGKVAQLEDCILLRLNEDASGNAICFLSTVSEAPSRDSHIVPKSSMESDMEVKEFQLTAAKNLLAQYINAERARELELAKWRKLYMATKLTLEMMQNGNSNAGFTNSLRPSKEPSIKQWLEAAKAQQAAELAERHWYEIDAFERHMKAKDERMEALRVHLISLDTEVHKRDSEIRELRSRFTEVTVEKSREELKLCMDKPKKSNLEVTSSNSMQTELKTANKKRSRNTEEEQEPSLREALERKTAELHLKDARLSLLESKLVQVQMQHEKERKCRESEIAEVLKEKEVLENLVKDSLVGVKESAIKNAIAAACSEVEKLSDKIVEASEELKLADTKTEDHLREVIQQATEVSTSGNYVKKIEGFLSAQKQDSRAPVNGTEQHVPALDENVATANMTNSARIKDVENRSDVDDLNVATREMDKRYEPSQFGEAEHALTKDLRGRETLERQSESSLAPMLKKQLRRYRCLLQRMNALSEQIAQVKAIPTSSRALLNSLLSRAVQLRRQVDTSGRKLALIQAGSTVGPVEGNEDCPQVLEDHLREIQRRLELKLGNMINDLRTAYAYEEPPRQAHGGQSASENGRPIRLERGDAGARSLTAQLLLQNQVHQTELHR